MALSARGGRLALAVLSALKMPCPSPSLPQPTRRLGTTTIRAHLNTFVPSKTRKGPKYRATAGDTPTPAPAPLPRHTHPPACPA